MPALTPPTPRLFRRALIFTALLLYTATLSAQQHDTRLSMELPEPALPADARIQDAATIGGRTLVVWGSTVDAGGGAIRNVLWMQFVESGAPMGEPVLVTGASAAPSGFLRLDTARGAYFIFWNDKRDGAPGGYMRRVDTSGTLGEEHLLDAAGFQSAGPFVYRTISGCLLLWNNTLPAAPIMAADCDSLGAPIGSPRILAEGPLYGVTRVASDPPHAVVDRGGASPLLLDEHGSSVAVGIPDSVLSRPYHLRPDGTVVTIRDSIVSYYHSLLDPLPYKTVTVSFAADRLPGSEFVAGDSAGGTILGYGVLYRSLFSDPEYYYWHVRLRSELPDTTFGALKDYSLGFWRSFHHCYDYKYRIDELKLTRSCKDRYEMTVRIHVGAIWDCISLPGSSYAADDTVRLPLAGSYEPQPYSATPAPCGAEARTTARRLADGYSSSVEVALPAGAVRLRAPVATPLQNVPQLSPTLTVANGAVNVAWLSLGEHAAVPLIAWDAAVRGAGETHEEIPLDSIMPDVDFMRSPSRPMISSSGGRSLLSMSRGWRSVDDSGRVADSTEYRFYLPVGSRWRLVRSFILADRDGKLRPLRFASVPDQPYGLIGYLRTDAKGEHPRVSVDAVDPDGAIVWGRDPLVVWNNAPASYPMPCLVPVGPRELLLLQGNYYQYFDGDSLQPSLAFETMGNPIYTPLLGSRFLRWTADDYVAFILHERSGYAPFPDRLVGTSQSAGELALVQNPIDSGIAFLYGGKGGVHAIVIDKSMNVLVEDLVVSETRDSVGHPAAVYVGDTLYVAWEDYRNGAADIYGRAIPFNQRLSAPRSFDADRSEHGGMIASIDPNPTGGAFTVKLRWMPTSNAIADVVDMRGVVVASRPIERGSDAVALDAASLPAGRYFVILRDDIVRGCAPLVVVR